VTSQKNIIFSYQNTIQSMHAMCLTPPAINLKPSNDAWKLDVDLTLNLKAEVIS
jgi:hypothetical protein